MNLTGLSSGQSARGDMHAMILDHAHTPLRSARLPIPSPVEHELLVKVAACGVCRTDLHIVDGELSPHRSPIIPGHEIVGIVTAKGARATRFAIGDRVGIPWLGSTCRHCANCSEGHENLCDAPLFTGYDRHGGYAGYTVADERYCFALPSRYDDVHAAPLLCAGLIGYRAYAMAGEARRIGIYGFGAAAHLITQVAVNQGREVFAFTRPGDTRSQQFARSIGAAWAGDSTTMPPARLDAALLFAPVGALVPAALAATRKGATVVCAGIHMSDIPRFPYALLSGERMIRSVANLTRADGDTFFRLIAGMDLRTVSVSYPLEDANRALSDLREGKIDGAAVLVPSP